MAITTSGKVENEFLALCIIHRKQWDQKLECKGKKLSKTEKFTQEKK